jgi:hypothetical protein
MSDQPQPTPEELRAAYEEQLRSVRVEEILVQTVLSLLNVGSLRAGLVPDHEGERDLGQLHMAIESVRSLLPLVERTIGPDAAQIRDALSSLQMAYARAASEPPADVQPEQPPAPGEAPPPAGEQPAPGGPGPAQRSGRLWVPGQ